MNPIDFAKSVIAKNRASHAKFVAPLVAPEQKAMPSQHQVAGPDSRAWQGIKAEAMRAPGSSPWLDMAKAGQDNRNITQMNNLAKTSPWGGMPTGEAAVGGALSQGIGGQAQAYGGQAASNVDLARQGEEQRQGWGNASIGAFNDLQSADKINSMAASKYGQIQNKIVSQNYARLGKTKSADILAEQTRAGIR